MIHRTKLFLSIVSVLLVSGALAVAAAMRDDDAQPLPAEAGNLARAEAIEVRDAAGQVVLSGRFGEGETDDDGEVERKADLRAAAGGARGEAEIEVSGRAGQTPEQELEVEIEGLPGAAAFTVHLDGRSVATLTTDERGRAEVKFTSGEAR